MKPEGGSVSKPHYDLGGMCCSYDKQNAVMQLHSVVPSPGWEQEVITFCMWEGASVSYSNIYQETGTGHRASNAVNDLLEAYWSMERVIKDRVPLVQITTIWESCLRKPCLKNHNSSDLLETLLKYAASLKVDVKHSSAIKGAPKILVSAVDIHIRDVHIWSDKPYSAQLDRWDCSGRALLVTPKIL